MKNVQEVDLYVNLRTPQSRIKRGKTVLGRRFIYTTTLWTKNREEEEVRVSSTLEGSILSCEVLTTPNVGFQTHLTVSARTFFGFRLKYLVCSVQTGLWVAEMQVGKEMRSSHHAPLILFP